MAVAHRAFKDRLYAQFARVGRALASPHRLEMLELVAQAERSVDSIAAELGLPAANVSQHLQALRQASLVERRRDGLFVFYRIADPSVVALCAALRAVAERRLADVERLVQDNFGNRAALQPVPMHELLRRMRSEEIVILDARPVREYEAGHIAGAVSAPVRDLRRQLRTLPKTGEFVAYCRGPYCVYADQAVDVLRASGRRAARLLEGFPEWQAAGLPVARGPAAPAPRRGSRRPGRRSGAVFAPKEGA